jgi:hypothetical protein
MPLMAASIHEHQEMVKWLVKAGADTQIGEGISTAAQISRWRDASFEQTTSAAVVLAS